MVPHPDTRNFVTWLCECIDGGTSTYNVLSNLHNLWTASDTDQLTWALSEVLAHMEADA